MMPTPIAHALGGIAAGCLAAGVSSSASLSRASRRSFEAAIGRIGPLRATAGLAGIGMLPDVDLFLGTHRSFTHSLGAMLLAAAIAGAVAGRARLPVAMTVAASFGSHILLDWLGADPSLPQGVMAWWPWTSEFYISDMRIFMRVCREYWTVECWVHNALAVVRELALLTPVTLAAVLAARSSLRGRGKFR